MALPGGSTVSFKYDPFGRRIQKTAGGVTTNFLYDGVNLLADLNSAGTPLVQYRYSGSVDDTLGTYRGTGTSFFQLDGLGSTTSMSDLSGGLSSTVVYSSFGQLASGAPAERISYTGREWESEAGLHYYRARYYDSLAGRFISEDPLRFTAGPNFYSYVNNNSPNFRDPFGLCPTCKVTIRCWPIQMLEIGALFGSMHCFAEVRDYRGGIHRISGGPNPETEGRTLGIWATPAADVPPDPSEPRLGWPVYFHDADANCAAVQDMLDITRVVNSWGVPYQGLYLNSNSALATVLNDSGYGRAIGAVPRGFTGAPAFRPFSPRRRQ